MSKNIILASNSPRRKELLRNLGIEFSVVSSEFDEKLDDSMHPYELACHLALEKAKDVARKGYDNAIIIAADTLVIHNKILGKPKSLNEAYIMLKSLSGNVHEVVTGVALLDEYNNIQITDYEMTKVYFRKISDEEINRYISTGESMDKAGAYGIQGKASLFIEKIDGDFFNVMGLPIYKLGKMMQQHFNYDLL